jgi:hypothetical protein
MTKAVSYFLQKEGRYSEQTITELLLFSQVKQIPLKLK